MSSSPVPVQQYQEAIKQFWIVDESRQRSGMDKQSQANKEKIHNNNKFIEKKMKEQENTLSELTFFKRNAT